VATPGLLDALPEDERRRVLASMRRRRFAKGETLVHAGDPGDSLHVIAKGHVAIVVTTPLGETATLTVLGPGDSFGEQALLTPEAIRTASARALEACETRCLHRDDFEALRASHPAVERFLTAVLAAQVRRLTEHLLETMYVPADRRVLRRLAELVDAYRDGDGAGATVPVTQEDLATMAGTTRPTVNRVLRAAQDDGVLAVSRGRVSVPDLERLRARGR
jgi:CRP-like cAMP-binding protein